MNSFAEIIDLWPSISAFASETETEYPTAAAWKQRNSIPPSAWPRVIRAANEQGFQIVTLDLLARLAMARKAAPSEAAQ